MREGNQIPADAQPFLWAAGKQERGVKAATQATRKCPMLPLSHTQGPTDSNAGRTQLTVWRTFLLTKRKNHTGVFTAQRKLIE